MKRPDQDQTCSLHDQQVVLQAWEHFRLAIADQPVAVLSEGEGGPKDPCGRRVESALKRDFRASLLALHVSAANTVLSRAMLAWIEDFQKTEQKLSWPMHNTPKKISLAAAFTVGYSLDALQFNAKALASNVSASFSLLSGLIVPNWCHALQFTLLGTWNECKGSWDQSLKSISKDSKCLHTYIQSLSQSWEHRPPIFIKQILFLSRLFFV